MPEADLSLGALVDMQIRANGPMPVASYMALCLTHPTRGYYRKADPLGAGGDFVTAPEISQTFGEMIGAWIGDLYLQMGSPRAFTILELGPGRGTLMADALRVCRTMAGFTEALTLALYETNPDLIALQKDRLSDYDPVVVAEPEEIAADPVIVIANEFFDALPIRQFVHRQGNWFERSVGLVDGKRVFGLSPTPYDGALLGDAYAEAEEGVVAEIGLAGRTFMERLGRLAAPRGGAILAIDYGYERSRPGETLQAVARHAYADPLEAPGAADLTAHVDFGALGRAASMAGLTIAPLVTQGAFLTSLGLAERHAALTRANPEKADALASAFERLTHPAQMGTLFKVLCAASPGLSPAGFQQR